MAPILMNLRRLSRGRRVRFFMGFSGLDQVSPLVVIRLAVAIRWRWGSNVAVAFHSLSRIETAPLKRGLGARPPGPPPIVLGLHSDSRCRSRPYPVGRLGDNAVAYGTAYGDGYNKDAGLARLSERASRILNRREIHPRSSSHAAKHL